MPENKQFDFLHDYIMQALSACGYDNLSEELKKEYVPQFVAHAETRIGAALLPSLTESMAKEMAELLKSDKTTPDDWANFWQKNVPNYPEIVKKTLADFAEELKQIFADIKK
jgi:hypothetical protein